MSRMDEDMFLYRDRTSHDIPQAAQFIALRANVIALEVEAIQEGRLILLDAAAAAGLNISAFAWQSTRLA